VSDQGSHLVFYKPQTAQLAHLGWTEVKMDETTLILRSFKHQQTGAGQGGDFLFCFSKLEELGHIDNPEGIWGMANSWKTKKFQR
jgi:hypothetical protein